MIKTQIQLPDALHRDLKRLAEAKEWSLAETLRRGAELLLARHPYIAKNRPPWSPPQPRDLGWQGLTHEEVHAASLDDMETDLPHSNISPAAVSTTLGWRCRSGVKV